MRKIFLCIVIACIAITSFGQNTLKIKVVNAATKEPLWGAFAVTKGVENGTVTDSTGEARSVLGSVTKTQLLVSHVGYETKVIDITLPYDKPVLEVELEPKEEEEEEVIIQSTRSTRTISDIPTRVEFVAGEELDEKANMKPGDIRMVLNESTGITTQQ